MDSDEIKQQSRKVESMTEVVHGTGTYATNQKDCDQVNVTKDMPPDVTYNSYQRSSENSQLLSTTIRYGPSFLDRCPSARLKLSGGTIVRFLLFEDRDIGMWWQSI